MSDKHYVFGIDLGTTNSCIAVVESEGVEVIKNRSGYNTTPSVVAVSETGKRLIGQLAKRQLVTNSEHTAYGIKRLIGRRFTDPLVRSYVSGLPFNVVEGRDQSIWVNLRGKLYAVAEISSMILSELKAIGEQYCGYEVKEAVITVPAYFNDDQRQATIAAGQIAGLDVLRIINEPTAAALAYGYGREVNCKLLVYDLGGGTFDVSVLDIADGVYQVLSSAGHSMLGGEDFDNRIIEHMLLDFVNKTGVDLRESTMAMQRLKMEAERVKCELSSMRVSDVNLPFLWTTEMGEGLHLNMTISREQLNALVIDLVESTLRYVREALREAGLEASDIDDVLLVGGMSRMPLVEESLSHFMGKSVRKGVHLDEAVAVGAALQGASLAADRSDFLLIDVSALDLGIAVQGGGFHVLIPRNSQLPSQGTTIFTTSYDYQPEIKIVIVQGHSERSSEAAVLGEFRFQGLRPAVAGSVDLEVQLSLGVDGTVSVLAVDRETGQSQSIEIGRSTKLKMEEIASMRLENESYLAKEKL